MGGLVIETIRPGVQFIPDAAAAFRRADAQVRAEFGRGIDVNSTYRTWADQMLMFENWNRYVAGKGPYPGHSKAVHPSESFHVQGVALDSDDWRVPRIVQILAENGFIRNRLYVKGEDHHFEWLRDRDKNYGKPAAAGGSTASEEDDMYDDGKHREVLTAARDIKLYQMGTGVVAVGDGGFWPIPAYPYLELLIAWEIAGPNLVNRPIDQNELTTMLELRRTLSTAPTGAAQKVEAVLKLSPEEASRLAATIAADVSRQPVVLSPTMLSEIAKAAAEGARDGGEEGARAAISGLEFVTTIAG